MIFWHIGPNVQKTWGKCQNPPSWHILNCPQEISTHRTSKPRRYPTNSATMPCPRIYAHTHAPAKPHRSAASMVLRTIAVAHAVACCTPGSTCAPSSLPAEGPTIRPFLSSDALSLEGRGVRPQALLNVFGFVRRMTAYHDMPHPLLQIQVCRQTDFEGSNQI